MVDARKPPRASADDWRGDVWRQAARPAAVESDFSTPALQAIFTGVIVGAPLGGVAAYLAEEPAWLAGVGFCCVTAAAWLVLLRDHRRLLWAFERVTGADLDRDGVAGPPEELRVEVSHRDPGGHLARMEYLTIPGVDADRLRQFARAVIGGDKMSVHKWTATGALFTRGEFDGMMATLEHGGLVTRGAGSGGRQLTRAGKAIFDRLAG